MAAAQAPFALYVSPKPDHVMVVVSKDDATTKEQVTEQAERLVVKLPGTRYKFVPTGLSEYVLIVNHEFLSGTNAGDKKTARDAIEKVFRPRYAGTAYAVARQVLLGFNTVLVVELTVRGTVLQDLGDVEVRGAAQIEPLLLEPKILFLVTGGDIDKVTQRVCDAFNLRLDSHGITPLERTFTGYVRELITPAIAKQMVAESE